MKQINSVNQPVLSNKTIKAKSNNGFSKDIFKNSTNPVKNYSSNPTTSALTDFIAFIKNNYHLSDDDLVTVVSDENTTTYYVNGRITYVTDNNGTIIQEHSYNSNKLTVTEKDGRTYYENGKPLLKAKNTSVDSNTSEDGYSKDYKIKKGYYTTGDMAETEYQDKKAFFNEDRILSYVMDNDGNSLERHQYEDGRLIETVNFKNGENLHNTGSLRNKKV